MELDFSTYSFFDLLEKIIDNRGKTCPTSDFGIPLIATNCVKNNTLYPVFEKVRYVDKETYQNWFRGHPEPGDMIFVTKGAPGSVCWTPNPVNFCIAQDMVAIRANKKLIDSKFLFALLRSQNTQARILNMHVGTMIPHFKKGDFKNLYFDIPRDIGLQARIGDIYLKFCEKIDLNHQINTTLESMAQALFKSWFVDFDPVIDNALAAGNPIPEALQARADARATLGDQRKPLPDHIRRQFPDRFVLTEDMGWVPEGWGVRPVYEIANFINGAAFKSEHFSDAAIAKPILKIAEIKNGVSGQTKFTTQLLDSKYQITHGDILFSWSGNPDTSIDTFVWTGVDGWLNQHIFKVVTTSNSERLFTYYLLKYLKPVFANVARDKQTTGLGHVTVKDLKRLQTIKPPQIVTTLFEEQVAPLFQRWLGNLDESEILSNTRDTLLPKLLSGELRIPEAEIHMEEVI